MRYDPSISVASVRRRLLVFLSASLLVSALVEPVHAATVLGFDGLTDVAVAPVAPGYGGLSWDPNFYVIDADVYGAIGSGYDSGRVSGTYAAYNHYESSVTVTGGLFDFDGAYLTGAWNNGLQIVVTGYLAGSLRYTRLITTDAFGPHWFTFDYLGIDELRFTSSGGTNAGLGGAGTQFVMDDFTFTPAQVACDDGVDDDGDGFIDLADPGCSDALDASERDASLVCDDGIDNDADVLVDFPTDPGCSAPDDMLELGECQNGFDDDGDGLVDTGDSGCVGTTDASEHSVTPGCDDGLDDDGDGLIDMADPGCNLPGAPLENPVCDDGIDNDGDGSIDFDDTTCQADWPYWETPPCGLGFELALLLPMLTALRGRHRRQGELPGGRT